MVAALDGWSDSMRAAENLRRFTEDHLRRGVDADRVLEGLADVDTCQHEALLLECFGDLFDGLVVIRSVSMRWVKSMVHLRFRVELGPFLVSGQLMRPTMAVTPV